MYARISPVLLAMALFATPLAAQTPQPAAGKPARPAANRLDPATSKLPRQVDDRLQFMRKMYALDASQLAKARAEMMPLLDAHETYMDGQGMMLRRLSKAILLVLPSQPDLTDAHREVIRKKLQRKIHRIHAEAPLSYANVAKLVEKTLGQDVISRGRKQMASSFARELAGAAVDINKLDELAIPPLRPAPKVAAAPTPVARPVARPSVNPPTGAPSKTAHDHPPHPGHEAHAKLPPPPKGRISSLRAPKPIVAAPPIARWPETLKASVAKYGFSGQQSKSAQSVLASCRKRAEAHLAARKTEYDQANQLADAKAKAMRINKLNTKINKLYHEMNQRIDSIASIEQRLAGQAAATKAPAEKKPAAKPPAKKVVGKKTTAAKADSGKPGT